MGWYVHAQDHTPYSLTGTTTSTTIASVPMPAGTLRSNSLIRVTSLWSASNTANTFRPTVRFGELATGNMLNDSFAGSIRGVHNVSILSCRNSMLAQVTQAGSGFSWGANTRALGEPALPVTDDINMNFLIKLSDVADTAALEAYMIEISEGG